MIYAGIISTTDSNAVKARHIAVEVHIFARIRAYRPGISFASNFCITLYAFPCNAK